MKIININLSVYPKIAAQISTFGHIASTVNHEFVTVISYLCAFQFILVEAQ